MPMTICQSLTPALPVQPLKAAVTETEVNQADIRCQASAVTLLLLLSSPFDQGRAAAFTIPQHRLNEYSGEDLCKDLRSLFRRS